MASTSPLSSSSLTSKKPAPPRPTRKPTLQIDRKGTSSSMGETVVDSTQQPKIATAEEAKVAYDGLVSEIDHLNKILSNAISPNTRSAIIDMLNPDEKKCFSGRKDIESFLLHMRCNPDQIIEQLSKPQERPIPSSSKKEDKADKGSVAPASPVSVSSDDTPLSSSVFRELSSRSLWQISTKLPTLTQEAEKACNTTRNQSLRGNITPPLFGDKKETEVLERKPQIKEELTTILSELKEIRKTHTAVLESASLMADGSKGQTLGSDDVQSKVFLAPSTEEKEDFQLKRENLIEKMHSLLQAFEPPSHYQLQSPNIPVPSNQERDYKVFPTSVTAKNPEKIPSLKEENGEHILVRTQPETIFQEGLKALTAIHTGVDENDDANKLLILEQRMKKLTPFIQAVTDTSVHQFVQEHYDDIPKLSRRSTSFETRMAKLDNQNNGKMSGPDVKKL